MWKTIAVVGAAAAIVGGAGTVALAASGTAAPAPASSSSSTATDRLTADQPGSEEVASDAATATSKPGAKKHHARDRVRRSVRATWVTQDKKTKTFLTHDAIRGQVTAVSPSSITVLAADKVSETYVVSSDTKVRTRAKKTGASIADVKTGDPVFVGGTGTTTLTAVRVFDAKK